MRGFPNVAAALRRAGLDPTRDPVPVAPAAHYTMGGIARGPRRARRRSPGLLAVGECACTGLHGANRLASNSLAECFVFGRRAGARGRRQPIRSRRSAGTAAPRPASPGAPAPPPARRSGSGAGLRRTAEGLRELLDDPFPLARHDRARARSRARRAAARTSAQDFPDTDPASTVCTCAHGAAPSPQFERWD